MNPSSETNDQTWPDWPVIMFLGGVNVCALSALLPGTFSWSAVAAAVVLHWLTPGVGVN